MNETVDNFKLFLWRVVASHVITYSVIGWIAMTVLNYRELFASEYLSCLMKPMDSPWIAAGPGLQVFRGLVFALVLWPFRKVFIEEKLGWFKLWALFLGLAILSTSGPTPGSIEGIIYTRIPLFAQWQYLPEIIIQTLIFSVFLISWFKNPLKILNIFSIVMVSLIILMSIVGSIYFYQNLV